MNALEIVDLMKEFSAPDGGTLRVLDIPRFCIAAGQQIALSGESGSGKTTLLHLIAGIVEPTSGTIAVHGETMTGRTEAQRDRLRAAQIGYVFQSFHLLPALTALENIELPLRLAGRSDRAYARALLARVGLATREHYRPAQLSTGQQQRVALARALANRPALVLADEPTGNLDRARADEVTGLLCNLCRENRAALLVATHDAAIVARFETHVRLCEVNRAVQQSAASVPEAAR